MSDSFEAAVQALTSPQAGRRRMALAEAAALFGRHVETLRLRIRDEDGNRQATHNQEVGIR
jgi:hypothetical protein